MTSIETGDRNARPSRFELRNPDKKVYRGYTKVQLLDAFNTVKDSSNWKNPIRAVIAEDKLPVVEAAIMYFTGSTPHDPL